LSVPTDAAADEESEAAEQALSASDEAPEPESEPWASAATLAATIFAQSDPDQTVSEIEPIEEPPPSQPALSAQPYEALDSGRWSAAAALAATTFAQSEPDQPDQSVSESEPDQIVSELEPLAEPAPAEHSWFAPADEAREPAPAGQAWFDPADEAPEPAVAEPVALLEPEAVESVPEPEPQVASDEAPPSEPLADENEVESSAMVIAGEPTPAAEPLRTAEPPWYDPGDEDLEAARSAAAPAFTPPDEPEAASALEPPQGVSAAAPPSKVAVSGKAASRPEPPPSQMALRTTQAVLTGVWKRLQKPPDPPR
jgi:hypothetical protein